MNKVMIVGSGLIAAGVAKFIHISGPYEIVVVGTDTSFIQEELKPYNMRISYLTCSQQVELDSILASSKPDIICSTAPSISRTIVQLAVKHSVMLVDLSVDAKSAAHFENIDVGYLSFVPQTGLAPGLVSYIGLELLKRLKQPQSLSLRVGVLPQAVFSPGFYTMPMSSNELVSAYTEPGVRLRNSIVENIPPLDEVETVIIDGKVYEGFTISGGISNVSSYDEVPNVEFKALRPPGHLEHVLKVISRTENDPEKLAQQFERTYGSTRTDVVVLLAQATDEQNFSVTTGLHFYPHEKLKLSAYELCTAGTGAAIISLCLQRKLPAGVLNARDIPLDLLKSTTAFETVFSTVR